MQSTAITSPRSIDTLGPRSRAEALVRIDPLPRIWVLVAVTGVEPLADYSLRLTLDDGSKCGRSRRRTQGPTGEPLRDPAYFRQVRVDPELRTVVWPNGFGLDADVLHGCCGCFTPIAVALTLLLVPGERSSGAPEAASGQ